VPLRFERRIFVSTAWRERRALVRGRRGRRHGDRRPPPIRSFVFGVALVGWGRRSPRGARRNPRGPPMSSGVAASGGLEQARIGNARHRIGDALDLESCCSPSVAEVVEIVERLHADVLEHVRGGGPLRASSGPSPESGSGAPQPTSAPRESHRDACRSSPMAVWSTQVQAIEAGWRAAPRCGAETGGLTWSRVIFEPAMVSTVMPPGYDAPARAAPSARAAVLRGVGDAMIGDGRASTSAKPGLRIDVR